MVNDITRESFNEFLKSGVSTFEGNIISDTGTYTKSYYRFMRMPLAVGEHKVDALYGQVFYGVWENSKPLTFDKHPHFLCLVVDDKKTVNETWECKTIFSQTALNTPSVLYDMAHKLFEVFKANVTENDAKEVLKDNFYVEKARDTAFNRVVKGYEDYNSPIDGIANEIGKGARFGLISTNADELMVDYLANPTGWAERTMKQIEDASSGRSAHQLWITLVVTENLVEEYMKKYSNPDTPEGKFKALVDSIKSYKNVYLGLDINGKTDSVKYPVDSICYMDALYDGNIDTWDIAPRSEQERIEKFLGENDAVLKDQHIIPFKYISSIYYGKKPVWKNPMFDKNKKEN